MYNFLNQTTFDNGISELKIARSGARIAGLRATQLLNLFGAPDTKTFQPLSGNDQSSILKTGEDQLRHAWALRAHYGQILPCLGETCVAEGADHNGKHIVLKGDQLTISVHQKVRFGDTIVQQSDPLALQLSYDATKWNDRIWARNDSGLCPSETSETADSTTCLLINSAGFVVSSSLSTSSRGTGPEILLRSFPRTMVCPPACMQARLHSRTHACMHACMHVPACTYPNIHMRVHTQVPPVVPRLVPLTSLDYIYPRLMKQLQDDGVFERITPRLNKINNVEAHNRCSAIRFSLNQTVVQSNAPIWC